MTIPAPSASRFISRRSYPIAQTHAEMPKELIARTGLDDRLLRLSVGLEDADDIIDDLRQALEM